MAWRFHFDDAAAYWLSTELRARNTWPLKAHAKALTACWDARARLLDLSSKLGDGVFLDAIEAFFTARSRREDSKGARVARRLAHVLKNTPRPSPVLILARLAPGFVVPTEEIELDDE